MTSFEPAPQRGNFWLGAALGVVSGLVIVALAWFALVDPSTAEPAPSPSAPATPASTPTAPPKPSATPTPSQTPTPVSSPSGSATPPATPEPHPGIVRELPAGSWVTVLDSLPQAGTTPERALERAAELSKPGHQAVPLDASAFAGLNPGYYAIVIPGQASRDESYAVCDAIGTPRGDRCYPREIKGPR